MEFRTSWHRVQWLGLWVLLIASAVLFEATLGGWYLTLRDQPYINSLPAFSLGLSGGRYVLAIPVEAAGRSPDGPSDKFLQKECVYGLGLRVSWADWPPAYMRIILVSIPCWFAALLMGFIMLWSARRLNVPIFRRRRQFRGFEPIMPAESHSETRRT